MRKSGIEEIPEFSLRAGIARCYSGGSRVETSGLAELLEEVPLLVSSSPSVVAVPRVQFRSTAHFEIEAACVPPAPCSMRYFVAVPWCSVVPLSAFKKTIMRGYNACRKEFIRAIATSSTDTSRPCARAKWRPISSSMRSGFLAESSCHRKSMAGGLPALKFRH